jgi:ABC-type multidrug transport system ATPase subunit
MDTVDALPEFIAVAAGRVVIGRAEPSHIRINHIAVSPQHAELSRSDGRLWLEDLKSQFGTYVNGERIVRKDLRDGDSIRFGHSVTYLAEDRGLRVNAQPNGMWLRARDVALSKGGKTLLNGVDFAIKPSYFVGIIGPSGAGKSTLLQGLSGYLQPSHGHIFGEDKRDIYEDHAAYQAAIGLVPQDDVVFPELTIRENLFYAARLRFGATRRDGEEDAIVAESLGKMDLLRAADRTVRDQCSGGQRKRLSVAIELLKRPRMLFLDEPTSGLDPALEQQLMVQLMKLTGQGTTVVCTTHHMDNLQLFDELVVLGVLNSEGRVAYVGRPQKVLEALSCETYSELFEKLARGLFVPREVPPLSNDSLYMKSAADSGRGLQPVPEWQQDISFAEQSGRALREVGEQLYQLASDTSLRSQLMSQLSRRWKILKRDQGLLLSLLAQPIGLGLLTVLSQFRYGAHAAVDFFLVVIAIWLGMNNSVRDIVRDRKTYVRERLAGLNPNAFYLSRFVEHFTVGAAQIVVLLSVLVLFGGVAFEMDTWNQLFERTNLVWLFTVLQACLIGGVGLGLLTSALVDSEEAAVASLPLLIMPQLLFSSVATGLVDQSYSDPRPFRPLALALREGGFYESWLARLVDWMSLLCLSRPGALLAESPRPWVWLGDLCHLSILLAATWAAAYYYFLLRERDWCRRRFLRT